jgi:uncharacterized membrane protein
MPYPGIASSTVALTAHKGGRAHRLAGDVFVASMMVMAAIGAAVSPLLPQRANVVPGMLTFYLVASSWLTIRPRGGLTRAGEILALLFAAATAGVGLVFGNRAAAAPGAMLDHSAPFEYYVRSPALPHPLQPSMCVPCSRSALLVRLA